jgi:hypothetical protein
MRHAHRTQAAGRAMRSTCLSVSLLALLAACGGGSEVAAARQAPNELPRLLVTDALQGNIEPCGCGGNFSGGLEDSVRSIALARNPGDLWVDMGLAIGGGPLKSFVCNEVAREWKQGNVSCICLGADELVFVDQLTSKDVAPLVCANYEHEGVQRYWDAGGLRFSSVVAPELVVGIEVSDPLAALKSVFAEAFAGNYIPVVGLHAKQKQRRRILSWLRGCEHRFVVFDTCSKVSSEQGVAHYGGGMVIRGPGRGRSHTEIEWDPTDEHYWALISFNDARKTGSTAIAKSFRAKVAGAVVDNAALTHGFVGSARCGSCHQQEFEQWQKTKHSHAMDSLRLAGKHGRADCYTCHITSSATSPTEKLLSLPPTSPDHLAHVGCESCHGAGARHAARQTPTMLMPAQSCQACHIGKFADGFDYKRLIDKVSCQPR